MLRYAIALDKQEKICYTRNTKAVKMKNAFLYNSEIQKILKEYHELKEKYFLQGIKKEPFEILDDLKEGK
jgi:hypothetical protein